MIVSTERFAKYDFFSSQKMELAKEKAAAIGQPMLHSAAELLDDCLCRPEQDLPLGTDLDFMNDEKQRLAGIRQQSETGLLLGGLL